jgi:hypothetical protein
MKKLYSTLILAILTLYNLNAQTTVTYPQRIVNYAAFFGDGGGNFDSGTTEFGMWANNSGNKQSVAWRNFTQDGTTTGTTSTMAIGDSFTITLNATRAYGQIGIALLSSPTATATWADRINNYAVQVNLNGNGGTWNPWEIVSAGGTINASTISGSTTAADFVFKFTLNSATSMNVDINNGVASFNVTVNNQNITGYSVYINDDWNGSANSNIYWKPTSEYRYATTLGVDDVTKNTMSLSLVDNVIYIKGLNYNQKFKLNVFDLNGRLVKKLNEKSKLNLNGLSPSVYILKLKTEDEKIISKKVIKP